MKSLKYPYSILVVATSLFLAVPSKGQQTFYFQSEKDLSQGYGYDLIDNPAQLKPEDFFLAPQSNIEIQGLQNLLPEKPNYQKWNEYLKNSPDPETPQSIAPSIEKLLKFNHDHLQMGGNITGGGEGVYYMTLNQNKSNFTPSEIEDGCKVKGLILSDIFNYDGENYESFTLARKEPYLKEPESFTLEDSFYGAPIDIHKAAPSTMRLIYSFLKKLKTHNPLFVELMLNKLKTTKFYTTNLPLKNATTQNGDVAIQLPLIHQRAVICIQNDKWKQPTHILWHETLASFEPHRGVIINNAAWSHLGDFSRLGLIFHELLRSFQYQDLFPMAHGQLRRVVVSSLQDPSIIQKNSIDKLLLTHSIFGSNPSYLFDNRRLRMACGKTTTKEYWIRFGKKDFQYLISRIAAIAYLFPQTKYINKEISQTDEFLEKFRLALVFSQLVKKFDSANLSNLLQSPQRPLWFELVDLKLLNRKYYLEFFDEFFRLYNKVCPAPEFSQSVATDFDSTGQQYSKKDLSGFEPTLIASPDQLKYLKYFDLALTMLKSFDPMVSQVQEAESLHPNIYLPAADFSLDHFYQVLDLTFDTEGQELTNGNTLQFFTISRRLPKKMQTKVEFLKLNFRYSEELKKANFPSFEFRNFAFPFIDN